jgi:bifunctional non-homologous end joining protein LigD
MATAALTKYRQKRDFSKTAEPSGRQNVRASKRLRFVIQKHAATRLHYDLRLELDGVFKSWAVTKGPSVDPADKRLAVEVEDHPLDYGDFEGTIPQGQYGGGTVQLWDRGYWAPEGGKTPAEALKSGDLKFTLAGERLQGSWVLVRMKGDRFGGKRTNWLLIKHKDAAAKSGGAEALLEADRSVASARSMAQIAAGSGPAPKPFMLAKGAKGAMPAADAVWNSNRDDKSRSALAPSGARAKRSRVSAARVSTAADESGGENAGALKTDRMKGASLKSIPSFIEPQLCKLVARPPALAGWAHEVKFDGYRAQLRVERGQAVLRTRNGLDWTERFAAIAAAAKSLPDCIIDGEVCALDRDHMPSFAALQAALSANDSENLVFFAFDLLVEAKEDLRPLPLAERKRRLEALLEADPSARLRFVQHFESTADTVLLSACKMHLEGIVSKRLDAAYVSGRSGSWTKAKCRATHEVVLGGWTTEGSGLRSLLAGVNRDGKLVYVGRIGTGYGASVAAKLLPKLEKLTRETSPFTGENAPAKEKGIRWLKPTLVAEIEFAGWTGSGMIRQAAFKGLRPDKTAREVVVEMPSEPGPAEPAPTAKLSAAIKTRAAKGRAQSTPKAATPNADSRAADSRAADSRRAGIASVMGVVVSKPDKVLWPAAGAAAAVTKLELAEYFAAVGEWLLPHLQGRPCSLVRAPDGLSGQQFFQRHAMAGMSNLFSLVKIKGDKAPYVQIDRVEALAAVAQMGGLEIHPWNCTPRDPETAGRLVFDLDPAPDVKFDAVIDAALEIKGRLAQVGLESYCKTTGGKGLHVVTELEGGKEAVKWPGAKNFAHIICAQMAADSPQRYLDTMSKRDRVGRIFLDYLRNDRTATAVAVLSPRARPGAPISMPIHWKAVKAGLDPMRYTIRSAPALLEESKPWEDYNLSAASLAHAIKMLTA